MRPAKLLALAWFVLAVADGSWFGASSLRAQDANGLWQDYRYPANNPNWRRDYEREVATWGQHAQELRPRYNSSPDMVWSNATPLANTPFVNQPFYTVSRWDPYVPRPVDWNGLEFSGASAPPESTTGNHGWYGASSPGPRGYTPTEWRQWELNTPEGRRYLAQSGLPVQTGTRQGTAFGVPLKEKSGLKQYFRTEPTKGGPGRWQERDTRVPPDTSQLPPHDDPEANGFKQYILNRPAATGQAQGRGLRIVRPKPVADTPPSQIVTPVPEHSGFTQFTMKPRPGTGDAHWEVKSKKPTPDQ